MKRSLFLALTIVVACSLFVMTAFGAESFTVHFSEANWGYVEADPLSLNGWYLTVSVDSYSGTSYTFDPIQLTFAPSSEAHNTVDLNVDGVNVGLMTYWADLGEGNVYFSLDRFPYDPYEADTTLTFTPTTAPAPDEPESSNFLADIGTFFTSAISWLGNVASFIVTRPVFLVVLAMPIIGFAVGLFSRIKNL